VIFSPSEINGDRPASSNVDKLRVGGAKLGGEKCCHDAMGASYRK
jgi:hypothetical protein